MDIAYQIRLFTTKLRKLDHQGKKHVSIFGSLRDLAKRERAEADSDWGRDQQKPVDDLQIAAGRVFLAWLNAPVNYKHDSSEGPKRLDEVKPVEFLAEYRHRKQL